MLKEHLIFLVENQNQPKVGQLLIDKYASNRLSIAKREIHGNKLFDGGLWEPKMSDHYQYQGCYLYIIANETTEINPGDWCLLLDDNGNLFSKHPQQYRPESGHKLNSGIRKIIASTNSSLNCEHNANHVYSISADGINKFVELWNQGNIGQTINKAVIEYHTETQPLVIEDTNGLSLILNSIHGLNDVRVEPVFIEMLISAYRCGYGDRDANIKPFAGMKPIDYLKTIIK